uniref:C2H2-type domain-containing protein n=1 Tax=Ornithorhynchus anatinus TaxID=9258 RepID=A0A6I8NX00_ORNAN
MAAKEEAKSEPEAKKEKVHQHPFYCNICKISCASALNLQTHFLGFKHKTVEEALKTHGIVKTMGYSTSIEKFQSPKQKVPDYVKTEPEKYHGQSLQEQLNTCKDSEPAVGLEYVTEYQSKENIPILYECKLCNCQTGLSNMFMHVFGSKHRLAYLKAHHPDIVESDEVRGRGSELSRRLRVVAANVEKKEGRKQIKVIVDPNVLKRKWQDYIEGNSKPKVQHMDPMATEPDQAAGGESEETLDFSKIQISQDDSDSQDERDSDEKSDDRSEEKIEEDQIYDENSKDCNNKLEIKTQTKEEYQLVQQNFEIMTENDASFILAITQNLTDALLDYRLKDRSVKLPECEANQKILRPMEEQSVQNHENNSECVNNTDPYSGFSANYITSRPPTAQSYGETSAHVSGSFNNNDASLPSPQSTMSFSNSSATEDWNQWSCPSSQEASNQEAFQSYPYPENHYPSTESASYNAAPDENSSPLPPSSDQNDVITEFFNSIRNMDVVEVTDTLQKIATTNPAFKEIDIPNVIRILTESGTLKTPGPEENGTGEQERANDFSLATDQKSSMQQRLNLPFAFFETWGLQRAVSGLGLLL